MASSSSSAPLGSMVNVLSVLKSRREANASSPSAATDQSSRPTLLRTASEKSSGPKLLSLSNASVSTLRSPISPSCSTSVPKGWRDVIGHRLMQATKIRLAYSWCFSTKSRGACSVGIAIKGTRLSVGLNHTIFGLSCWRSG